MKKIKEILTTTMFIVGSFLSVFGGIALYLAGPFLLVLFVLKVTGALIINWFGYPVILSVIGTPFWLVFFGLSTVLISMLIMFIAAEASE